MIEFSEEQVDVLKKLSIESYISEITEHCRIIFPLLTSLQKKDGFRSCIQQSIVLAKKAGYTQRGPIRLYVDIMIILGTYFDSDPLFQKFKIRVGTCPQIEKSVKLYTFLNDYLAMVYGENGRIFNNSFEKFKLFSPKNLPVKISDSNEELHEMLRGIYPQRYEFVGSNAVSNLISLSNEGCEKYKLKRDSHRSYLILIMFLFGYSFEQDFFRGRLVTELLLSCFGDDDINNHNAIVSCYSTFQVNYR